MSIFADTKMNSRLLHIPKAAKGWLNLLFLAKHACANGEPDVEDGTHAVYHHELLCTMRSLGLTVDVANTYDSLFEKPRADFVVPLLNRGGFQNSEMLAPLLIERHELPYLGASPILRGMSDDKHLMKLVAQQHGVPTMAWATFRRDTPVPAAAPFDAVRYVVKPNASSASWGVKICDDWQTAQAHVVTLHAAKQDVIVEAWADEMDVAVPVIGGDGPIILPAMAYTPENDRLLRSYEEKRGLVAIADDPLTPVTDASLLGELEMQTRKLMRDLWPFDYGRFEFRVNFATGKVQFMEVNLSCNLWSKKSISRSAASIGISHTEVVESILAHSMQRQGLLTQTAPVTFIAPAAQTRVSALVLAGQREGHIDPLAEAHGLTHKSMVPVAGIPMIEHVLLTLVNYPEISEVLISMESAEFLAGISSIQPHLRSGRLRVVNSCTNLADSVISAALQVKMPLVITTADNVLLTHDIIREFITSSRGADVAVGLTSHDAVLTAHPEGQKRFYEFGKEAWSGCNLYWMGGADTLAAIEIFRSGGQFVKHPGRILKALGITNLVCFLFGIGSVDKVFMRLSRRLGLKVRAVTISDGSAAIDVDNMRSHAIAQSILLGRKADWRDAA